MQTTRQVLFVQGGGERVHDDWDARLVESLRAALGPSYAIRYPRMPNEADPSYIAWKAALEWEFAALKDGAILVGHSLGGAMLVHSFAELQPQLSPGAIILIAAPFVGDGGWKPDDWEPQRDLGAKLPGGVPIYLYHGLADDEVPPSHAELYAREMPHEHRRPMPGRDHQLDNDLTDVAALIKSLPGNS